MNLDFSRKRQLKQKCMKAAWNTSAKIRAATALSLITDDAKLRPLLGNLIRAFEAKYAVAKFPEGVQKCLLR